jgi:Kef-type K+ transport system membrane component KefB
MGVAMGTLVFFVLQRSSKRAEFIAIALGSVAFAGGLASYLLLSPIVVCFFAGIVVANLESAQREPFRQTLADLERPIFFVFLLVAGALWNPFDWRGWALVALFLPMRYLGQWLGSRIARVRYAEASRPLTRLSPLVGPLSPLAIAVVLNAQSLYPSLAISWIVTAVIGGALISEVIAQIGARLLGSSGPESMAPPLDVPPAPAAPGQEGDA